MAVITAGLLSPLGINPIVCRDNCNVVCVCFPKDLYSPNLKSLSLVLFGCVLRFPRPLPIGLTSLSINCHGFDPAVSDVDIDELPVSLKSLKLFCRTAQHHKTVAITKDKRDWFCSEGKYKPIRQRPICQTKILEIYQ